MPFRVPWDWRVLSLCFLMALAAELVHAQAPTVSGVSIVTTPASGDTYELAEGIQIEISFDQAVEVTGSPQLALNIGGSIRHVELFELDDTKLWSFDYFVQGADSDADGISINADALTLNDGTIKARGAATDAVLDLGSHAISNSGNHKVDGTRETAPTVTGVTILSRPNGAVYGLGEQLSLWATFDRAVEVPENPWLLRLALTVGGNTRQAEVWNGPGKGCPVDGCSGGGTNIWFAYYVQQVDRDVDGIDVPANALTLNGATMKILGGTTNAVLGLGGHAISTAADHKVDGSIEASPTADFVEIARPPPTGDTFREGDTIPLYLYFDLPVAVTGTPQLALTVGEAVRQARHVTEPEPAYILSRGRMVFEYVVAASDRDVDGVSIEANALSLNGGTIKIRGGTTDALLTLPASVRGIPLIEGVGGHEVDGGGAGGPMDVSVESAVAALRVSWQVVSGASSYKVQWRVVGGVWSSSRQGETTETQYEIAGLTAGDYEVRVVAVVDGEDGEPSAPVQGEVAEIGNQRPRVVDELPDLEIDVGETVAVNAAAVFEDADRDRLRYSASSDADLLSVRVAEGVVRVRGVRPGEAIVFVTAEDPAGLDATTTFRVTVGTLLSVEGGRTTVPEGGTVVVALDLSRPLAMPLAVRWNLGADEDASTADANMADYGEPTGEVSIPAGQTSATIEIAIINDADIEPAREHFVVQVEQPEDENVGLARNARVEAMIQEGVCDRTPTIRDELSQGWRSCHWPKPTTLAAVRSLDLSGQNIDALRSNDLLGLHGLRRLDLSNNALATLPAGLFAGVEGLREVSVEGNPGAPFTLTVELARLDAEPWAPGPAQLVARTAWAAPFTLASALSASPTDAVAGELPEMVEIAAGAMAGQPFSAASNNGTALALRTDAASLPSAQCGDHPCFRGFQTMPGPALTLFRQPPRALPSPTLEPLQGGDELRLPLASLVEAADPMEELRWQATSSDDALATVRIVDGSLVVTPELATAGTVEVTLVVTDTVGFSTTLRLEVSVEFHWPRSPTRGWRGSLMRASEQ